MPQSPVEARDQSQIEIFGPRVGSTISAMEVCDEIVIGPLMAQAILQRELYVRTKFTFKLSWDYCLLDPMDIVTLTDTNLGLSNYPVRIIEIQEDDKGLLSFTCEELVTGVSTPQFYANASTAGSFRPNWGVPAVPINAPLIFEPNPGLTGGGAQVWFGASGIDGGGGSQWGGANVYISIDDVTYSAGRGPHGPDAAGVPDGFVARGRRLGFGRHLERQPRRVWRDARGHEPGRGAGRRYAVARR